MAKRHRYVEAARVFFSSVFPNESWDYTGSKAKPLILGAFQLYAQSWGNDYDVRDWQWPAAEWERRGSFEGLEPWTVLLRAAVAIAPKRRKAVRRAR